MGKHHASPSDSNHRIDDPVVAVLHMPLILEAIV